MSTKETQASYEQILSYEINHYSDIMDELLDAIQEKNPDAVRDALFGLEALAESIENQGLKIDERLFPHLKQILLIDAYDIEQDWESLQYLLSLITKTEQEQQEDISSAENSQENEKTWIADFEERRISLAREFFQTRDLLDKNFTQYFQLFEELLRADQDVDVQSVVGSFNIEPINFDIVESLLSLQKEIELRVQTENIRGEDDLYQRQIELVTSLKDQLSSFEPTLLANKQFFSIVDNYSELMIVRKNTKFDQVQSINDFSSALDSMNSVLSDSQKTIDVLSKLATDLQQQQQINFLREVVSRVATIVSGGKEEIKIATELLKDAEFTKLSGIVEKLAEYQALDNEINRDFVSPNDGDDVIDRRVERLQTKQSELEEAINNQEKISEDIRQKYLDSDFKNKKVIVESKKATLEYQKQINSVYRRMQELQLEVNSGVNEERLLEIQEEVNSFASDMAGLEARSDDELKTYSTEVLQLYEEMLEATGSKIFEEQKQSVFEKLEERLHTAVQTATYVVDSHHDEVWHAYESIHKAYETFAEKYGDNAEFERKLKIEFYKIYRRIMLEQLEQIEREEQSSPSWKGIFQDKILGKSQNLVQSIVGIELGTLDKFTEAVKSHGTEQAVVVDTRALTDHERNLIDDFNKLRTEFVARKFLHLSWMANRVEVLGRGTGSRNFPNLNIDENWPVGTVLNYLMKDGLRSSEVGEGQVLKETTNPIVEEDRVNHPLGFSTDADGNLVPSSGDSASYDSSNRGTTKHDVALFEDVYLAMDDWVAGTIKARVGTGNVHTDVDGLAEDITNHLKRKYPDREDITKADVRRGVRAFLITTFHQSARSHRSAILSDKIMYQCSFYLYSEKYSEDGTAGWNPNFVKAMYAYPYPEGTDLSSIDPKYVTKGNYVNTIPILLGEHEEVEAQQNWLWRTMEGKPYTQMVNALTEGGFLIDIDRDLYHSNGRPKTFNELDKRIQERLNTDHFIGYNFLTRPLIRMADTTQVPRNKEVILPNPDPATGKHYKRVFLSSEKDMGEMYTQMPPLATVFITDDDGNVIRYEEKGRKTRGVSLFDLRNEYDQILYGLIDWDKYGVPLATEISGLHKNGANFLDNFLKTKDVLRALEDPARVSELLNDAKYVLRHLPDLGQYVAAGLHNTDEVKAEGPINPYYMLDKGFMRTIIAQMVFHGCLARMLDDDNPWRMQNVQDYLIKLLRPESNAISIETAEAIYIALNAAMGRKAAVKGLTKQFREQIKNRFKHS